MKISPTAWKITNVAVEVCQILNKNCPKSFKILPKQWNFTKSGHSGRDGAVAFGGQTFVPVVDVIKLFLEEI